MVCDLIHSGGFRRSVALGRLCEFVNGLHKGSSSRRQPGAVRCGESMATVMLVRNGRQVRQQPSWVT